MEEFHINHCTYSNGNGHVLMNRLSMRMQSAKEIRLDKDSLELSMYVFKDLRATAGRGAVTLNEKVKVCVLLCAPIKT